MSRNFTPEQTLLDRLLVDDAAAFEELSRRYCYSLYTYCMSKLNSKEDSKRIVRNIFIALWEDRHSLPASFSLSLHLYTQVRKSVVQCIHNKLNSNKDVTNIEQAVIPGFSASALQKAKNPVRNNTRSKDRSADLRRSYEEQWWQKYTPTINLKDMTHLLKNMLNAW
jgi:DNA-directed RNA polymerase specialized sigma24 family protein